MWRFEHGLGVISHRKGLFIFHMLPLISFLLILLTFFLKIRVRHADELCICLSNFGYMTQQHRLKSYIFIKLLLLLSLLLNNSFSNMVQEHHLEFFQRLQQMVGSTLGKIKRY